MYLHEQNGSPFPAVPSPYDAPQQLRDTRQPWRPDATPMNSPDAGPGNRRNTSLNSRRMYEQQNRNEVADQRDGRLSIPSARRKSGFEQHSWGTGESPRWGPLPSNRPLVGSAADKVNHFDFRWMSATVLCVVLGLVSVAAADTASLDGYAYTPASVFFWFGLILIFGSIAARVLVEDVSRHERLILIVILGMALYIVKIMASPGMPVGDEWIHLRTTQDILRTQHLFAFNPLLPTAAYYPGLPAAAAGLASLSGLSPFVSGLFVIGASRLLISACFFLIAERIAGSSRSAAGASLIYAANPMFLFFSSAFAYEDLALPLAAFVVWWLSRTRHQASRLVPIATVISIVAVTVTHHVAGFALAALLSAWWGAERLTKRPAAGQHSVGLMALVACTTSLVWFLSIARPAASYLLANNVLPALQQTDSLVLGHTAARHLYTSGGYAAPVWQTVAGFSAVALLLLALPLALYRSWNLYFRRSGVEDRRRRHQAPMAVAICIAVVYPFILVPRLAPSGVAISARSWEYVFTGLGCVIGSLVDEGVRRRHRQSTKQAKPTLVGWHGTLVAVAAITLVFVGNITIGTAFYELLPEQSHPQGYPWTVQPDTIDASKWALKHLGANQRFGANSIDAIALATYGEQNPVQEDVVWPIFFAKTMNETVIHTIETSGVRYLLVNWQMTKGIPATPGYYFSIQEPDANEYTRPFPAAELQKFTSSSCVRLIYHSGYVQIFDVSRIENGSCTPRATGVTRSSGSAS